jgi:hypothetical protein
VAEHLVSQLPLVGQWPPGFAIVAGHAQIHRGTRKHNTYNGTHDSTMKYQ